MLKSVSLSDSNNCEHLVYRLWSSRGQFGLAVFLATFIFSTIISNINPLHIDADDYERFPDSAFRRERSATPVKLEITQLDSTQYPIVSISVLSTDLPMDMLRLPIQIVERIGDTDVVVTNFAKYPEYVGARRLIVVNHDQFNALGSNGDEHQSNFEAIIREIYDHPTVFTNDDWLSAYQLAGSIGATQIAEWSQTKENYFIDLVTHPFDTPYTPKKVGQLLNRTIADDKRLPTNPVGPSQHVTLAQTDPRATLVEAKEAQPPILNDLRKLLQRFEMLPPQSQSVESVILFSDSEQSILKSGRSTLASLRQYAQQNQIYIHGVHMARLDTSRKREEESDLEKLVRDTNGIYIYYQSKSDLLPLWTRLNEEKQRTNLNYQPSSIDVEKIEVRVMLPDGAYASSKAYAVDFTENNTVASKLEPIETTKEVQTTEGSIGNKSLPYVALPSQIVVRLEGFINRYGSAVGLTNDTAGITRELLLILWATCLGLLFFLIVPEIARGWHRLRLLRKRFAMRRNQASDAMSDAQSVIGFPATYPRGALLTETSHSDSNNGYKGERSSNGQLQQNGLNISEIHAVNGNLVNGNNTSANGHVDATVGASSEDDGTHDHDAVPKLELGRLIRITYDSSLPAEIPIHQASSFDLDEIKIYIGRTQQNNTIVISDRKKRISREHAILVLEKGLLYLQDNDSVAGTFLNGGKIESNERKLLRDRDRIGFGSVEYQIQMQSEEPTVISISGILMGHANE